MPLVVDNIVLNAENVEVKTCNVDTKLLLILLLLLILIIIKIPSPIKLPKKLRELLLLPIVIPAVVLIGYMELCQYNTKDFSKKFNIIKNYKRIMEMERRRGK